MSDRVRVRSKWTGALGTVTREDLDGFTILMDDGEELFVEHTPVDMADFEWEVDE